MSINFPNSPTTGQLYTFGETTWQWSGEYWNVYSAQTGYITSVSSAGNGFPVINSLTSNSLSLKSFSGTNMTIIDSGGQLNFYVPLNGGGGGQLYYFNISKTQTPYRELATSATTGSEQTITSGTSSGTTVTLGQFLTPSGFPGVSIIPGGVWTFYLHAYKQNASASFTIYCDVYKRTTGGTETLLLTTDPVPITANSPTPLMFVSDAYYSGTTINTSDRLLVNVRATNTGTGTTSVTFVSEGTQHYSYMSSPLLLRTSDIYVDSFTYTPSANTITIGQTENFPPQTIQINSFSGLSVTGKIGIGTITPSQLLHLSGGSGATNIFVETPSAIGANLYLGNTNNSVRTNAVGVLEVASAGSISFFTSISQQTMRLSAANSQGRLILVSPSAGAVFTDNLYRLQVYPQSPDSGGLLVSGKTAIGTTPSQASAILEVNSTSQGILPPRMSTTDRNNINLPAQGLILYNTTTDRLTYRDANTWEEVVNVAEVSNNISPAVNLFNFYNFY
jgi:hypothetical protein